MRDFFTKRPFIVWASVPRPPAGTFVLPGGSLIAAATIATSGATEGAITGGTGQYAGARGTFTTKEAKGPVSPVTVTLLE